MWIGMWITYTTYQHYQQLDIRGLRFEDGLNWVLHRLGGLSTSYPHEFGDCQQSTKIRQLRCYKWVVYGEDNMFKIGRNDPCPCGSGEKAKKCCLKSNGHLEKQAATVIPHGPSTGFAHPKCFANSDHNCSDRISDEHFISAPLLHQIEKDNTIKFSGLSWQEKERFKVVPIPVLASKILCTRHNLALSPLDSAMGCFSQTLQDYDDSTHPSIVSLENEARLFAGEDIERWMLKCLLGATYSNNFSQTNMRPECLDILYERIEWPSGWGLYVGVTAPGQIVYHSDSFRIETLVGGPDQLILAARFVIRGLPLYLGVATVKGI